MEKKAVIQGNRPIRIGEICVIKNDKSKKEYIVYGLWENNAALLPISDILSRNSVTFARNNNSYSVNYTQTKRVNINELIRMDFRISKNKMDQIRKKHNNWKNRVHQKHMIAEKRRQKNRYQKTEYKYNYIRIVQGGAVNPR